MDHIDLSRYFVEEGYKTGRPRCDVQKLLKVILFAFMENGICSLREIEKLCRNDIRFMYLLDGMKTLSFATFGNLIRNELTDSVVPLMEKFNRTYGHYPKYPVADAGYGSYNNYLYCEEHGMEKYMKFTMYKKQRQKQDADLLRNRKVYTKKRQNRHLPELAFLKLGTYFTAPLCSIKIN